MLKTDLGLGAGRSREPREKVTAAKQAGGDDEGGLDHGMEAGGEMLHLGYLKVGWTEFADRLDGGCERQKGGMVTRVYSVPARWEDQKEYRSGGAQCSVLRCLLSPRRLLGPQG